ncbi:hypothetical protein M0804_008984 [Polistes exclamans]|nr:hypothetical protein M0804_008984 [Polistes exclamans]
MKDVEVPPDEEDEVEEVKVEENGKERKKKQEKEKEREKRFVQAEDSLGYKSPDGKLYWDVATGNWLCSDA